MSGDDGSNRRKRASLATRITDAYRADLVECYLLSGAFPEGDHDWRLAQKAVGEVRRLREEHDELVDRACELEDAVAELLDHLADTGIDTVRHPARRLLHTQHDDTRGKT